jgi:hypothetical protein
MPRSNSGSGSLSPPRRYQRGATSPASSYLPVEHLLAVGIQRPLGHHQQRHHAWQRRRDPDADLPAHAVTDESALVDPEVLELIDDRPGVVDQRVREVDRFVALAVAEQVDQQRASPAQGRLDGYRQQLPGR